MNHPRYRVKTLLIATTIAAVVVACLAPWLRLLTGSQVVRLALGILCVLLGAGLGWLVMRMAYRYMYSRQASANPSYHLKFIKLRPKSMTIGIMSSQFAMALFLEFAMPPSMTPSIATGILWATGGFWLSRAFPQPLLLQGDVLLTYAWLVHPYQLFQLQIYHSYRWKDREAGILELSIPAWCKLELLVRPEDIDAVETLLSRTLSPPSK